MLLSSKEEMMIMPMNELLENGSHAVIGQVASDFGCGDARHAASSTSSVINV